MFEYEIGGRKFVQKSLVLGQVKQLISVIRGVVLPQVVSSATLVIALGDRVPEALAVVLSEENVPLKKKNMRELQELLEENLSIEQSIGMIEDFFDCNPIASISGALVGLAKKVETAMMNRSAPETSLTDSALPSQEVISPSETISSGDSQ
jgi:hypothetical protein